MRWAIALGITAVLAMAAVALAVFVTGNRSTAAVGPTFLPQGTVAYVEIRLDLPGDQRQSLVGFLSRFPGFDDPSSFERKINDTLDRLTREASGGAWTYSADLAPWVQGEVAMGITRWPDAGGASGFMGRNQAPPLVGAISIKDRAAAEAFITRVRTQSQAAGSTFSEAAGNGATIVTWQEADATAQSFSYAITDDLLLFAVDMADLRTALDVRAGAQPSLAGGEAFSAPFAKLPADRVGAMYLDFRGLYEQLGRAGMMSGIALPNLDQLPTSMVGALRVENDRMALEMRVAPGAAMPLPGVRDSGLAGRVPANTVVYLEQRDLGQSLRTLITQFKTQAGPALPDEQVRQLEDFLGAPLEDFLAWAKDLGIAFSVDGERYGVGLVATVTDEAVARTRIERLTSAARAAVAFGDVPVEVVDEQIAGVTVTTIRLTSEASGLLPPDLPVTPSLSYVVHDGVFALGMGDFVAGVLGGQTPGSLASNADFSAAIAAAGGANNAGSAYVDLAAIRDLIEKLMPSQQRATYETEVRPYLESLDRFVGVWTVDGGSMVMRLLLFVE